MLRLRPSTEGSRGVEAQLAFKLVAVDAASLREHTLVDGDALTSGLREELITVALQRQLEVVAAARLERRVLPAAELEPLLAKHARSLVSEWLRTREVEDAPGAVNALAEELGQELKERYELVLPPELLSGIRPEPVGLETPVLPERPQVPLTANELLVNDRKQPSIGSRLKAELQSAKHVDLICAFVVWSGVVTLLDELGALVSRGGTLRVITTTYVGVTDPKAVCKLSEAGADVRVAFDAQRTKLHAKAWIMPPARPHHRIRGFLQSLTPRAT